METGGSRSPSGLVVVALCRLCGLDGLGSCLCVLGLESLVSEESDGTLYSSLDESSADDDAEMEVVVFLEVSVFLEVLDFLDGATVGVRGDVVSACACHALTALRNRAVWVPLS